MKKPFLIPLLILIVITSLAFVLRFYQVTANPPELYIDEVAIGFNAYSILQTGRDEWGNPYPFLFRSFNDYKPPLYIYTVALFEKFLGPTALAVRLPAVISGTLTVLFVYFLTRELLLTSDNKLPLSYQVTVSLLTSLLLAISPWHLQFTRAGFEASLTLLFIVIGAWLFLLSLRKKIWFLLPALLFFSLATMTYHNARVFIPPFSLVLFLLFWETIRKNIFLVTVMILLVLTVNLPYLSTWFSPEGRARLISESLLTQPGNLLVNIQQNFVGNFSLDYLFFHGDQAGRHSVKKLGELYLWQLPFLAVGSYLLIKNRDKNSVILLSWLLLAAVPAAITKVSPHALRGFIMVIPLTIISAQGVVKATKEFPKISLFLIPVVLFSLALYLHLYYFHYPKAYAADWGDGSGKAVKYLQKEAANYDQIFVYKDLSPMYLLFYLPFDPKTLQNQNHNLDTLGKYQYFNSLNPAVKRNPLKKSLIVAPPFIIGKDLNVLQEIRMVNGNAAFEIYEF